MHTSTSHIPESRPLSTEELELLRWLLEHGFEHATEYLRELPRARVVGRCACGCASVDFAVDGDAAPMAGGIQVLSDYEWRDADARQAGIFVFARGKQLAGLEVYTLHPDAAINRLPAPAMLYPLGGAPIV